MVGPRSGKHIHVEVYTFTKVNKYLCVFVRTHMHLLFLSDESGSNKTQHISRYSNTTHRKKTCNCVYDASSFLTSHFSFNLPVNLSWPPNSRDICLYHLFVQTVPEIKESPHPNLSVPVNMWKLLDHICMYK